MKKFYLFLVITLFMVFSTFSFAAAEESQFVILHTNDFHGQILPHIAHKVTQPPNKAGGSSYLATVIKQKIQKFNGNVLLLDAGDMFQGSYISNKFYGRPVIEIMNKVGYTACTLGNHEFDWGLSHLKERLVQKQFPCVSSNIVYKDGRLLENTVPYIIKEINGLKIGILGLTIAYKKFSYDPSVSRQLIFMDEVDAVRKWLPALEKERVDVIIALSHLGDEKDRLLAEKVPQINIIVGGHSHKALNKKQLKSENIVNNTVIIQAGCYGEYLGELVVYFDKNARKVNLSKTKASLIPIIANNIQPDREVEAIVQRYKKQIPEIDKVISTTEKDLLKKELAKLICRAVKKETKADIALYNKGGVRNNIYKGEITFGDVYNVLPFGNKIITMNLTGKEITAVIKHRRLYKSGLPKELNPTKIYRVAVPDYLINKIKPLQKGTDVQEHRTDRDIFIDYLRLTNLF